MNCQNEALQNPSFYEDPNYSLEPKAKLGADEFTLRFEVTEVKHNTLGDMVIE